MSKYIETTISAAVYQRCRQITISNPYQATPIVAFDEEQIIKREDGSVLHDLQPTTLVKHIDDFNYAVPVYNPQTQEKTGQTVSIAQVYTMIWSVYMHEATIRDAQKVKNDMISAFNTAMMNTMSEVMAAAQAIRDSFTAQDLIDLAMANAAIETAVTQDDKDAILLAYQAERVNKLTAAEIAASALVDDQRTLSETQHAQMLIAAQAAYDAAIAV